MTLIKSKVLTSASNLPHNGHPVNDPSTHAERFITFTFVNNWPKMGEKTSYIGGGISVFPK